MSLKEGLPPEKAGQDIDLVIAHWCMFSHLEEVVCMRLSRNS